MKQMTTMMGRFAALLLALVALPAEADDQVQATVIEDMTAVASFESWDSTGCILTTAYLSASIGVVNDETGQTKTKEACILLSQTDTCTGELLMSAVGAPEDVDVTIQESLKHASLRVTTPLLETTQGYVFTVTVEMNWVGTGGISYDEYTETDVSDGYKVTTRVAGWLRTAVATGTVSDGTTDYTPIPAAYAQMDRETTRERTVEY